MNTIQLIAGQYSPEDAKEMLFSMLHSKANFHKLQSLSTEIRYGRQHEAADRELELLQEARAYLQCLFREAEQENLKVKIESSIRISFEEPGHITVPVGEVCSKVGAL